MLNLFKMPFRARNRNTHDVSSPIDLSAGLITNFVKQNKGVTSNELDQVCKITAREMRALKRQLSSAHAADRYEIMAAALRRIEDNLNP